MPASCCSNADAVSVWAVKTVIAKAVAVEDGSGAIIAPVVRLSSGSSKPATRGRFSCKKVLAMKDSAPRRELRW